jgi:monoterpene epsilon-lactone hydrolase
VTMRTMATEPWSVIHPLTSGDRSAVAAIRATVEPMKGGLRGPKARPAYDDIFNPVPSAAGVQYEAGTIGGVPGWWCRPAGAGSEAVVLYLHGGSYVMGSARSYRHFVSHIAARAKAPAFVADYRLAPEHPFPDAVEDAEAVYRGLAVSGVRRIALAGDSAGGGLALVLLSRTTAEPGRAGGIRPAGMVGFSPWTDLMLTGSSWDQRAAADPIFVRDQMAEFAQLYLGDHDPSDPLASPLYGDLAGLPPIRIHVGEDEVLLDDARRYVAKAVAAGVDARVEVWQGMLHVFPASVGRLAAADAALAATGAFLAGRLR